MLYKLSGQGEFLLKGILKTHLHRNINIEEKQVLAQDQNKQAKFQWPM